MYEAVKHSLPSEEKPWLKYYSDEAVKAKVPEMTAYELLYEQNKEHTGDTALIYYGKEISYGELLKNIESTAGAFYAAGVRRGDTVIICTVNLPETVYAVYALDRLGAAANMIDPRTDVNGVRDYINESAARLVVAVEAVCPLIIKACEGTNVEKIISISPARSLPAIKKLAYRLKKGTGGVQGTESWDDFILNGQGAKPRYAPYDREKRFVIAHTGGTTGRPKGVVLTDYNFNAVTVGYHYSGVPTERQLLYYNDLPPFIMYGLCFGIHMVLCLGLRVILYPVFDSKAFPKQFVKYRPNLFSGVADHLKFMLEDKKVGAMDLSFLASAGIGGDGLSPELEAEVNSFLRARGCKADVVKGYGMTELTVTACVSFEGANAVGSVGVPLVLNTVKIMNTETHQELDYDQVGEIWISSPSIMQGYFNKPEETAELIHTDADGTRWVRTGDLGYLSPEGLLYHKGRIRRIYLTYQNDAPAKVFPTLVEEKIRESELVFDCSVVGRQINSSNYFETVAYIIKKDAATDDKELFDEARSICVRELPSYMCPVEFRTIDAFPRTPIGKVDFRALERECAKG